MSKAWKELERQSCRDMGGNRRHTIGPEGWARGSDDDGSTWCYLETKYVARYALRRSWIEKARREAAAEHRPWVIRVKEHRDRHSGLFICSWDTGVELSVEADRVPLGPAIDGSERPATEDQPSTSNVTYLR